MMLRASVETKGGEVDLTALTGSGDEPGDAIEGGPELLAFADAVVGGDPEALGRRREALTARLGEACLVDAAAVAANFQRMNRIADATGIPLDGVMLALSEDFRGELGLDDFATAARTAPLGPVARLAAPLLRSVSRFVFPLLARRAGARKDA